MGMQEYSARLIPSEDRAIMVDDVMQTLQSLHFRILGSSQLIQGAHLAVPPEDEVRLILDSRDFIIEALLKSRNGTVLCYADLQFAVCQPMSVASSFLRSCMRMTQRHGLTITDGRYVYGPNGRSLSRDIAFGDAMKKEVEMKRKRWQEIFQGDDQEIKIPASQAWNHFMHRHPSLSS